MRQIVLDTETTGLTTADGHRIIEIGCVELDNRRYTGRKFHQYFNPERAIDDEALQVHGIGPDFLAEQSYFREHADSFITFIKGAELLIHNAEFDIGFLNYEFKLIDPNFLGIKHYCSITDTLALARQKHPGQQNSLDALCRRYQVDNSQRDYHGALLDAKLLAEVYLAMTGGQGTLFVEQEKLATVAVEKKMMAIAKVESLPIVYATEEEAQAHLEKLNNIKKKNGKVIWTDDLPK